MNLGARAGALLATLATACGGAHPGGSGRRDPPPPPPRVNVIPAENSLPGAVDWRLHLPAGGREIEGYALRQSALPGDAVDVAVSTSRAGSFDWTLYRLGHYGGAGAREVARGGPVPAAPQPACPADPATGLVACAWAPAFTLRLEPSWPSGLYALKLVRDDGYDIWVPLVVRDPAPRPAELLLVVPTATWQAYNAWGGESLYEDARKLTGSGRAFRVSYDRPYGIGWGAGDLFKWDHRLAWWLEAQGEDVAYATDEDLDADPALAARARAVVLSAHDEYWSGAVRTAVERAVAGGTSLLLFGANAGFWQVRYGPAADGRARRVVTCFKADAPRLDPVGPSSPDLTVQFRQPPVSRPEGALFGVQFHDWNAFGFPLGFGDGSHWALAGTGLSAGDVLTLAAGYEVDVRYDGPGAPAGVEIVGGGDLLGIYGGLSRAQMVVRREGSALVFATGGVDFVLRLAGDDRADPRAQRIAANVLARALGRAPDAKALVLLAGVPRPAAGPCARAVETIAGAPFLPGSADGPAGEGRLRQPIAVAPLVDGSLAVLDMADGAVRRLDPSGALGTLTAFSPPLAVPLGLAADAAGNVYVADTGNACIRRVDTFGRTSVLAGACGTSGAVDGPAAVARFMSPAGLALAGTALYVADTGANAVRRIDLAAPDLAVTTLAPAVTQPTGVAVAADGTVYVAETGNARVVALARGALQVVAGGVAGFADGPGPSARVLPVLGLAVLPDGGLAVADTGNYRVRVVRGGAVTTLAGSGRYGARDGPGDAADLVLPTGLAVDAQGRILVADTGTSTVRRITP